MIQIRPVSDLRNKYPEIENIVAKETLIKCTRKAKSMV